jgi:hypothetical protein
MNKEIQIEELSPYKHGDSLSDLALALIEQQIASWELPARNYMALKDIKVKELKVGSLAMKVQFNPSRIVSSSAKVDAKSIRERKCFLCIDHLPEQQKGLLFEGTYLILINPFPIFPKHLTIPALKHTDQRIRLRLGDMLELSRSLYDFVIFYNGPKCGASAPDHMHFQAGNKGFMPLEKDWNKIYRAQTVSIVSQPDMTISRLPDYRHAMLVLESADKKAILTWFEKIYTLLPDLQEEPEPMMNLLCRYEEGRWTLWVFPRKLHRPKQYFAEGDDNILISPASVDLGGVFITPLEKDFRKISAVDIEDILGQISLDSADFEELCRKM